MSNFDRAAFYDRWAAALESGDYEQGTMRLRGADDTYCCLGVACDLLAKDGFVVWEQVVPKADYLARVPSKAEQCSSSLPASVRDMLGLTDVMGGHDDVRFDPTIAVNTDRYWCLSVPNDVGESFKTIAGYVRQLKEATCG